MATNDTAEKKIMKAKVSLLLGDPRKGEPFFGSLLLGMEVMQDPTCMSMWTDGKQLGYNENFVDLLSLSMVKTCLVHEMGHIASLHHLREGNRDHEIFNRAGDHAINLALKEQGYIMPELPNVEICCNAAFRNMSTEAIYDVLYQEHGKGGKGGTDEEEDESSGHGSGGNGKGKKQKKGNGNGKNKNNGQDKQDAQPNDPPPKPHTGIGEVRKHPEACGDQNTQKRLEDEMRSKIQNALSHCDGVGSLPADMQDIISDFLEPKLDWRRRLEQFVEKSTPQDYRWIPPNRKFVHMGLYLPGAFGEEIAGVVAIDTSGSTWDPKIHEEFCSELTGILGRFKKIRIHIVYCDTKVQKTEIFTQDDLPLKVEFKGGGGTKFSPVFEWVEKESLHPKFLVYMTDLECYDFGPKPDYPVMWFCVEPGNSKRWEVPWGEVIEL